MSSDNGVYILVTPSYPKKTEDGHYQNTGLSDYRVAVCQNIDDIQYSDMIMVLYFHDSPVFHDKDEAWNYAVKMAEEYTKDGGYLEYGIEWWYEDCKYYPNATYKAAKKILDCYEGATPLDYNEE